MEEVLVDYFRTIFKSSRPWNIHHMLGVVDKLVKMTCMQGCFRSSKMRKCYNLQAHVSYKIVWTQSKKGICFVNKMFFFNGAIDYKYGPMVILLKMGSTTSDMGR